MNISILRSFLVLVLLSLCHPIFAQTISDENILKLFQNPTLSETLMPNIDFKEKADENLLSKNQSIPNLDNSDEAKLELSTNYNQKNEETESIVQKYYNALTGENLNVYGSSEFKQDQDDGLLFFNTVGNDYRLAPGDTIKITVTGLSASNKDYQVMNDGTITLPNIYPLNVNGLTLDQVSKLLLSEFILDDASADVFIRLNAARLVTVQISGNVISPRTIAVPAYTPLSRVIGYSGGVSDTGSLRNISLSQAGEKTQNVDFYDFLENPLPTNDPLIKNSARIFVPNQGATIAVSGFLGKPGIYELPKNKTNMHIGELLALTGTNFIPPGANLKISYFNSSGKALTRAATKQDIINQGEALILDFISTREINKSVISGAVLKEYTISTNKPLSINKVLKGGAVLEGNAFTSFALIIDDLAGTVAAINLNRALRDDSILLPVGAKLEIFNRRNYFSLVSADPNSTNNSIPAKLISSKIPQIYLNGKRIAYVAPSIMNNFSASLSDFYSINSKTVTDIALIQNEHGIEAFTLEELISDSDRPSLSNGDKLFIFENKFYQDLMMNVNNNSTSIKREEVLKLLNSDSATNIESLLLQREYQVEEENYLEALNYSKKLLQKSNAVNVKLDGKLISFMPYKQGIKSSQIQKKLANRLPKLISEFVIYQDANTDKMPQIKNLNNPFEFNKNGEINFITHENYRTIIKNYEQDTETNLLEKLASNNNEANLSSILTSSDADTNLLSDIRSSDAIKVYYDGSLVLLLPPNSSPSQIKLFEQYYKKSDLYKLYVGLKTINPNNGSWSSVSYSTETFFSRTSNITLGPSNVVNLFSTSFIRKEFVQNSDEVNGINFNISKASQNTKISQSISNQNSTINPFFADMAGIDITAIPDITAIKDISNQNDDDTDNLIISENNVKNNGQLNSVIEHMKNSLRTISGSVQFPGSYPVANKIKLYDFISSAELIKNTAKPKIRLIEAVKKDDRLIRSNPKIYDLNGIDLQKITLTGLYYLDIPFAINDAITGIIEVKGEVLIPGRYSFRRSETVQDIIKRAGGLSDVAFPLGAVLQRVSVKELEKETNNILADQVEASILNLAQSSLSDAGEQVKVVLGYAAQLRNQPTEGRMALNILESNPSNPQYLENGDKLTIPKRPSHVTIVGSVQRSTIAAYVKGQNFRDYLQTAGGVTKIADIRKSYLLLPNNESRMLNKSTVIPVGSVIIVPPKLDRLSILAGSDIISKVLNNISNSFLAIQNVD
jgi:protein involved in polysaccharide export with SLBB domain